MKAQFEEFWTVVALAPKTRCSLIATFLVPPVMLMFGTFFGGDIAFAPALAALSNLFRNVFLMSIFIVSAVTLIKLVALTYRNYIQDRKRLFEHYLFCYS